METMKYDEAIQRIKDAAGNSPTGLNRAREAWSQSQLAGIPTGQDVDAKAVYDLVAHLRNRTPDTQVAPAAPSVASRSAEDDQWAGRISTAADAFEPMMARLELAAEFPGAGREPTGLDVLDKEIALRPATLTVVGGREGAGKSALMLQMASNMAFRGPVAYVYTEMSAFDIWQRLIACHGHIEKWKMDPVVGSHPETLAAARRTHEFLMQHNHIIPVDATGKAMHSYTDGKGVWHEGVLERLSRMSEQVGGFRAVFIDNLWGLAHASGLLTKASTSLALGSVTKTLREFSTESRLNCPIVLAHHLNREAAPNSLAKANANGAEVGPSTENLGGSDQVGFDAEAVFIVTKETRPEVSQEDAASAANFRSTADDVWGLGPAPLVPESTPSLHYDDAYIHITKNRNGQPNKRIKLRFYGAQQRFEPVDETAQPLTVTVNTSVARDDAYNARRAELPDFYSDL